MKNKELTHVFSLLIVLTMLMNLWPSHIQSVKASDLTIGQHHNAALDYFYRSEQPIEIRKDGNISLHEYEHVLKTTMFYAIENLSGDTVPIDVYVIEYLKILETMGLVIHDGGDAYIITNPQEVTARQIAYLLEKDAISQQLADELNHISKMARNTAEAGKITNYVTNDFANHKWSEKDAKWVALYVDVFLNSAKYWKADQVPGLTGGTPSDAPWWVIVGADALGAIAGGVVGGGIGGPGGVVIGGIGFGAACSAIASTWD